MQSFCQRHSLGIIFERQRLRRCLLQSCGQDTHSRSCARGGEWSRSTMTFSTSIRCKGHDFHLKRLYSLSKTHSEIESCVRIHRDSPQSPTVLFTLNPHSKIEPFVRILVGNESCLNLKSKGYGLMRALDFIIKSHFGRFARGLLRKRFEGRETLLEDATSHVQRRVQGCSKSHFDMYISRSCECHALLSRLRSLFRPISQINHMFVRLNRI